MGPLNITFRIAALAGAGFLAMRKAHANAKHESLGSILYKDWLNFQGSSQETEPDVEKYAALSQAGYTLPEWVRTAFNVTEYEHFDDTFICGRDIENPDYYIFNIHGGGYWGDPQGFYYPFLNRVARLFNAHVILPVYPKSPTYKAPVMHEMVIGRYRFMIEDLGIDPKKIIFMGDSAGGGLALSVLQLLRDRNIPLPKCAWLISPWLDVSCTNDDMDAIQPLDPMLNRHYLKIMGEHFIGDYDPKDPLVSPIYGDLTNLVPITIVSATYDILHADIMDLELLAKTNNLPIEVYTFPGLFHVFPCVPIPESDQALGIFLAKLGETKHTT